MKNLPIVMKLILNTIFYVLYWALSSFLVGIVISIFMGNPDPVLANKIWIFLALLILLVTLIFRKYFYIGLYHLQEDTENKKTYTQIKKEEQKKTKVKKDKIEKEKEYKEEDEIKIYVEKEIK